MTAPKVLIVNNYGVEYTKMFQDHGWETTDSMEEADLVQFTGGSDVTPAFYFAHPHPRTAANKERDEFEKIVFLAAKKMDKPLAGICRGGQFLNVMNGGTMWQHVEGHLGEHIAFYTDLKIKNKIKVTSTHHQMMCPANDQGRYFLLMVAENCPVRQKCSSIYAKQNTTITVRNAKNDVEALYYRDTNCLCFQPHPEFTNQISLSNLYFEYINNLLLK